MFKDVIGDWPMHDKFILTSCDNKYFEKYFARFYKTYSEHWKLPIHIHIIDPTQESKNRLSKLPVSYTYCTTDASVLRFPYSFVTYCQAQRFILLGHKLLANQSVIVADVDSYAQHTPTDTERNLVSSDMAFTKYNGRLMATFCNFHNSRRKSAMEAAMQMQQLIEDTEQVGVDQLVIKQVFKKLPYNILPHGKWIRHLDVKTDEDIAEHGKCLIYHEKGCRGKGKGLQTQWTDIGL